MISHIHITDFAIIDHLSVDFHPGLNIITGETGAGKSIIIEAISLALGSRADSTYIRSGKDKALVQIHFDEITESASLLLEEWGIDSEGELIITREISQNGKNICRINNQAVPLSSLNRLCKFLADIHGQYDHQSLLNPDNHVHFIDSFSPNEISPLLEKIKEIHEKRTRLRHQLSLLQANESDALRKRDFMEFELQEILGANLIEGEDEVLKEQVQILQNSEKITENLEISYDILYSSAPSVLSQLKRVFDSLDLVKDYSIDIHEQNEIIKDCYYQLQDSAEELRRFKDHIDYDRETLDNHISRLEKINQLKRKYGTTLEDIFQYQQKLQEQLCLLSDSQFNKDQLNQDIAQSEALLKELCDSLTAHRQDAAKTLKESLEAQMKELNFEYASIYIHFEPIPPGEIGSDRIEFLISTNKGESPKPLSKVASGGEISRIMLAFKSIFGMMDALPSMIFDEIDSGISGITASIVGKKLRHISSDHQVLCITHLPQIAAFGDYHFRIKKKEIQGRIVTTVEPLDEEGAILELARLTGGLSITQATLENARQLLSSSKDVE